MTTVKPYGACCIVIYTMQDQQQQNKEMMMIDNMTMRHLMFMLMQCTAQSKRSAVEDKDGRRGNR